jgi:hypothetical protein
MYIQHSIAKFFAMLIIVNTNSQQIIMPWNGHRTTGFICFETYIFVFGHYGANIGRVIDI